MIYWNILAGGITPVSQTLDKVCNKLFKGFYCDLYDLWSLTAPVTDSGAPKPPTRQQLVSWVVEAWEKVPEEMCAKAWTACGYKTKQELAGDSSTSVVPYDTHQIGQLVERLCGQEALVNFNDSEMVDADPPFLSDIDVDDDNDNDDDDDDDDDNNNN
jgi:hypothetical protein